MLSLTHKKASMSIILSAQMKIRKIHRSLSFGKKSSPTTRVRSLNLSKWILGKRWMTWQFTIEFLWQYPWSLANSWKTNSYFPANWMSIMSKVISLKRQHKLGSLTGLALTSPIKFMKTLLVITMVSHCMNHLMKTQSTINTSWMWKC